MGDRFPDKLGAICSLSKCSPLLSHTKEEPDENRSVPPYLIRVGHPQAAAPRRKSTSSEGWLFAVQAKGGEGLGVEDDEEPRRLGVDDALVADEPASGANFTTLDVLDPGLGPEHEAQGQHRAKGRSEFGGDHGMTRDPAGAA